MELSRLWRRNDAELVRFEQEVPGDLLCFVARRTRAARCKFNASREAKNRANRGKQSDIKQIGVSRVNTAFVLCSLDEMGTAFCHLIEMTVRHGLIPVAGFAAFEDGETMKVGITGTNVDQGTNPSTKLIGGPLRWLGNGRIIQNAQSTSKAVGHHGLPEAVFGFEMIEQQALRHLGFFSDLPGRGTRKTLSGKALSRRPDDARARTLGKFKCLGHLGPL